jgi:hypothetical protein
LIEAWNVGDAERDLALAVEAPINGTDPSLRGLATKSAGCQLFKALDVPTPDGIEGIHSAEQVIAAVSTLRARGPVERLDSSAGAPTLDVDRVLVDMARSARLLRFPARGGVGSGL